MLYVLPTERMSFLSRPLELTRVGLLVDTAGRVLHMRPQMWAEEGAAMWQELVY